MNTDSPDPFDRQKSIFSEQQMQKIQNTKISIAGVGGLGSPVAYLLTRIGFRNIKLADPDEFELSNINRQFGCYLDTININKAEAVAIEIKRINPSLNVQVYSDGVHESNLNDFLADVDILVDALDFNRECLQLERKLSKACKEKNIWYFTSQSIGEKITFTSFNPKSFILENIFSVNSQEDSLLRIADFFFPEIPNSYGKDTLIDALFGRVHIPSYAVPPHLGSAILVEEIISNVIGNGQRAIAPDMLCFDLRKLRFKLYKNWKGRSSDELNSIL